MMMASSWWIYKELEKSYWCAKYGSLATPTTPHYWYRVSLLVMDAPTPLHVLKITWRLSQSTEDNTVSSHINSQFRTAYISLFGPKVIFKFVVTQCESSLRIMLNPAFILIWLETHWAFMRVDTVLCTFTMMSKVVFPDRQLSIYIQLSCLH